MIRSDNGYFGEFGGRFVPEILLPALTELEDLFFELRDDPAFWQEYLTLCQEFSGRPTPLTPLRRLSKQLGGAQTLKEALDEALRDWAASVETTHYVLGTACGPAPFPEMVSYFQAVIGDEIKTQSLEKIGRLPDEIVACVGGGSNAMGAFGAFLDDPQVGLVGVEAGGISLEDGQHSVRLIKGTGETGIAQGYKTLFLQNDDGQLGDTHSIAAGLDYVGVSPILAYLSQQGRVTPESASDDEVTEAFSLLMKTEGIIPALESSHGLAGGFKRAQRMQPDQHIVINLSGRGDKDIFNIARAFPQCEWTEFLQREAARSAELLAQKKGH